MKPRYSLGIQTFSRLINEGRIYVDKTELIYPLVNGEGAPAYFFSRPRRFGKSLLISTLKSIFEGEKELFKGLYIYDKLEWKPFPIIHLSMDRMNFIDLGLEKALQNILQDTAQAYELQLKKQDMKSCFEELINLLVKKYQSQIVILIDEYDSPITQYLERGDFDKAEENRNILRNFYGVIKPLEASIRFLFITGITKFTKVSIFSELNHLIDLTLNKRYATLLGYTQEELTQYFSEGIKNLAIEENSTEAACLAKIKDWYNGFSWDGVNFVYNPFSFLQLIESGQFQNYWFNSGTPGFLIQLLKNEAVYELDNLKVSNIVFETFDLRKLNYVTLLLQSGYLTLKEKLEEGYFRADFPNKEVQESFNKILLASYTETQEPRPTNVIFSLRDAFYIDDVAQVITIIDSLFAEVPYYLFSKKDRFGKEQAVGENFYHAVIYLIFNLLGIKIHAEVAVRQGRIDVVVEMPNIIYLFEFKKDQSPEDAIAQIKARKYPEKYALSGKMIRLVGVNFTFEARGIASWKEENFIS